MRINFFKIPSHFLIFIGLFYSYSISAQTNTVLTGSVVTKEGEAVIGATVSISSLGKGTATDENGHFKLENLPFGTYQLEIKYMGYKHYKDTIMLSKSHQHLAEIQLEEDESAEVAITAKSENQEAVEQTIKAEVVDTKAVKEQPVSLAEVMNRSSGIRVRQNGGLGSNSNMLVNGYQGRSIKYFKDGVPMDYLGAGYDLSFVPVNMLERAEVYKGVLPPQLGADALGGAVNFVTRKSTDKYLEASYEAASFNTHRLSLNGYLPSKSSKSYLGADAFFNYSDNNYRVTVTVVDTGTAARSLANVKLFHNTFTNYYTEVYGGVKHRKWADELRIGLTGFFISKQNQFGTTMSQSYGAATSKQYSFIPTLQYRKSFFNNKLKLDQFLVANTIHTSLYDTVHGLYDWYGKYRYISSRIGEMTTDGSAAELKFKYRTSRTNIAYRIHHNHQLNLNGVYTALTRVGSDPYGEVFKTSKQDILAAPAVYNKMIASIALESKFFNKRIDNVFIVKYYHYKTSYTEADYVSGEESHGSASNGRWGIADAIKILVNDHSFLRISGEAATRLPEQDEIFGDGNFRLSNFQLLPEKTVNGNLGFRTEKKQKYALEVNTFYRVTQDLILNVAPVNFVFSQYQNVQNVKGLGFEADARVHLNKWLVANGNVTYQNFRIFNTNNPTLENARLKNTPFFFANAGLSSNIEKLFSEKDKLQLFWYYSFVREYYLDYVPQKYEPSGFLGMWGRANFNSSNIIPNQNNQSIGMTYFIKKISVSFMVKNILNAKVYDNFKVQNAGRSFHLKFNMTINKSK